MSSSLMPVQKADIENSSALLQPDQTPVISFWDKIWIQDDEEDGSQEGKGPKEAKRHPPGTRQYLVLAGGLGYVTTLSGIYGGEPTIAAAGGTIADFIKQVCSKVPEGSLARTIFRITAAVSTLTGFGLFAALQLTGSNNIILQTSYRLPWVDMGMAVGVKCELPKLEKRIIKSLEENGLGISSKQLKIVSKMIQGTLAAGLVTGVGGIYVTALAAIFLKSNIRGLVDMLFGCIKKMENIREQRICFVAVSALMALLGTAGFAGLQFAENPFLKIVLTVLTITGGDTIMRVVKRILKAVANDEEDSQTLNESPQTLVKKSQRAALMGAKVIGGVIGIVLLAYFAGTQLNSSNLGLGTVITQEITSPLKIVARGALKSVLPEKLVLPTVMGIVALLATLYVIFGDQQGKPWYGASVFATIFFITLSLYTLIPELQGAKIVKEEKKGKVDQKDKEKKEKVKGKDKKEKKKEKVPEGTTKVEELLEDGTSIPLLPVATAE